MPEFAPLTSNSMRLISLPEHLDQYESALHKFAALGVRVDGTRLALYRSILRQAVAQEAGGFEQHQAQERFRNAVLESAEIVQIAQLPVELLHERTVNEKLKRLSSGREFYEGEGPDPARDLSLEFSVAADLQSRGMFGGFSALGGDVTLLAGNPVECKRISSWNSVEKRAKEARDQLNALRALGAEPGIVVLDITKPILAESGYIEALDDESLGDEAERRASHGAIKQIMRRMDCDDVRSEATLGLVSRTVSRGAAGSVGNIRRAEIWQALCYFDDGTSEDVLFRKLASNFGNGELRDATQAEVKKVLSA